ncbi:MAG: putative Ig domain-containing protein [Acidovorax sp.]|nr:putative Ig domain-containing protein [Acidovorax sp.]
MGATSVTVYTDSSNNTIYTQTGKETSPTTLQTAPSHGTVSIVGSSVFYTPAAGYSGSDSFMYVTHTKSGGVNYATQVVVNVTVTFPPPPTANAVSATVAANSSANAITLSTSGIVTSVAVAAQATYGTATASGTSISYTPTAGFSGTDTFSYTASNAGGTSSAATVTVTVTAPTLTLTPTSLPAGTQGTAYSQGLGASLGTGPYSYAVSAGSLPAGLTLSTTGSISGTPSVTGSFNFTVQATDVYGAKGSQSYTLQLAPIPLPVAGSSSMTVAANSNANPVPLSLSGGTASSVAVAVQAAHGTATASGSTISYTPVAGYSGSDSFQYTATNASGSSSAAVVSITVTQPTLSLAPSSLPSGMVNASYSQTLTASLGTAPYTYAISAGSLPDGLSLSASAGEITGTPTVSASYSFTVQATDSYGASGTQSYVLAIAVQIPVASAVTATVAANSSANPITLSTQGPVSSVAVAVQAAYGTATASGTTISYTPTAGYSGADSFQYTASNSSGTSNAATVTVTVNAPTLSITPGSLPAGTVNTAYSQGLTASLGQAPYSYAISAGSLPDGLALNPSTGQITGTPTVSGSFNFTVQATDSHGATGSQSYTLTTAVSVPVANAVTATVAANSSANAIALNITKATASSVAVAVQATHGTATASGTSISYTPVAGYSGSDSFQYTATNTSGTSAPATVTVTVTAAALGIAPSSLPSAMVNAAYSQTLVASMGTAPYTYVISTGALPAGLSLNATTGQITGTPTASGSFSFTIQVTDSHGATGSQTYTQTVAQQTPQANAVTASVAANSSANGIALSISGGTATSVAVTTQAAHGIAAASGTSISYTPVAGYSGSDSFQYTASNAGGTSAAATVNITVTAPTLNIAPSSLPAGMVGKAYSQGLAASQGQSPYTYTTSVGSWPNGLSLDPTTGQITGTPTVSGSFNLTVQITDSNGVVGSQSYTLTVVVAVPVANAVVATVAANSSATDIALNITGGAASSVAVAVQAAHGTATASGLSISYTPVAGYSGSDSFQYTATNASGTSAPATVTVNVTQSTLTLSPSSLPSGRVNTAYSQTLTASQGTAPYTYAISAGSLPAGLSLASGQITGTPSADGSFSFTVQATDSYGATGFESYTLAIAVQIPVANAVSATVAANSQANAITLGTTGVVSSVAVTAQAAHGTATASGRSITYTPNAGYSGTDSFSYIATNSSGSSNPAVVSITVTPPTLSISPSNLSGGTVGTTYSQGLTASLGTESYHYTLSAGSLPPGLSLSDSGSLSGTPAADGSFSFTVQATDFYGATGSQAYTLVIAVTAPVANGVVATVAANSSGNDIALNITGGAASSVAVAAQAAQGTATASGTHISYTPAAGYSGADSFQYTATNASGTSAAATVTLTITASTLVMAPSSLHAGAVNTAYSETLTSSGGQGPYTYAVSAGSLPAGLTLNAATGQITGTPSASGSFSFTIQVTDSHGATGSQTYTQTVAQQAPQANAVTASVAANSSATAIALNITGGTATSVAVQVQAAHGLATASGTSISYSPVAGYSGADSFQYTASNAGGMSSAATVNITVTAPTLSIVPSSLPAGTVGTAYSQGLTASLGGDPYLYTISAGSLPGGLNLDQSMGQITGTPTVSGDFSFTVQARDSYGATGSQAYTLTVTVPAPVANAVTATVAANSTANTIALNITRATATSVAVVVQATQGMATASGSTISYSPVAGYSGVDSFQYTASNAGGVSSAATASITVTRPVLAITPSSLSAATAGASYSQGLSASLGTAPYTYVVSSGALPSGLSLSASGNISGIPTASGVFSFTVQATDSHGATGVQSYTLALAMQAPTVNVVQATVAANSQANAIALNTSGSVSSVAVVTQAAHGTATASGISISYTPDAGYSGADSFSYSATNSTGTSSTAMVSMTVTPPTLVMAPASLPSGTLNTAYSQDVTASKGGAPYTYSISAGALPAGLSLDKTTGQITGTPTASGSFNFTIQAVDVYGASGGQSYTLSLALPVPVANNVAVTVAANSQSNAIPLNITSAAATTVAVVSQATHGTATASGSSITYTPVAGYSGADSFTYTASNASGTSAPATVSITDTAPTLTILSDLPTATLGTAYSQGLAASEGMAPYTYTIISGALPAGLSLSSAGSLSGTPMVSGSFSFTLQATDSVGATGARAYTMAISALTLAANPASVSVPANSQANRIALNITGSPASSVAVVVQAAHGTAVASGASIYYTPNVAYVGKDVFSYNATNASGTSAAAEVAVWVSKPQISASEGRLPDAAEGSAYSQTIVATGGTAPYTFVLGAGALPPGLELSRSGQITGVPKAQAAGSFSFSVVITDAYGASVTESYTLRVNQALPIAPTLEVALVAGSSVEVDLTAAATGKPFTGVALLSLSPADAGQANIRSVPSAVASDGPVYLLRFTSGSRFSGAAEVSYNLSNTAGTSAPAAVHIQVTARSDPSQDAEVSGLIAAQLSSAHRFASVQIANFSRRLESLHADGWEQSSFGLTLDTGRQPGQGQEGLVQGRSPMTGMFKTSYRSGAGLNASGVLDTETMALPNLPERAGNGPRKALTFWVSGTVKYGREYVPNIETKYRFTTSGISAGADWRVSDRWTLGAGLGVGKDHSYVGDNGSQSSADNPLTAMLYASLRPGHKLFVDGLLGYGRLNFDSTRYITDGGGVAQGTRSGNFMLGSLTAGMEFRQPSWMWSPYARLDVVQVTLDTYSESAAGLAALTYYAQQSSVRNAVLGLRTEGLYLLRWGTLMPHIRVEYTRNMQHNGEAQLAYADLAYLGPAYAISPFSFSSGNWSLGLGARLQNRRGVEFSLELNLGFAPGSQSRSMVLGLRLPF